MTDISALLASHEKLLSAQLQHVRAAVEHSTQKGNILENAVRDILESFLPDKIGVTEGIIIDSEGLISNQIDIILFDRTNAHLFLNTGSTKVVPAEYVYAIGEVKAQLDAKGYDTFESSQKKVKLAQRYYRTKLGDQPPLYAGYGKPWKKFPIASFIVCFEASAANIYAKMISSHKNRPVNLCIDTIVCAGSFHIRRSTEYGADLYQGTMKSLDLVTEHCLHCFLGMLAKAAENWELHEYAEIYRYFTQYSNIPNSKLTTFSNAQISHPDLALLKP